MSVSAGRPANADEIKAAYAEMIFHYTNAAALLEVVTKRKLWMTHVDFVNDQLEFRLPLERFRQMIEHRNILMSWGASEPTKFWEAFNLQLRSSSLAHVACFSKTGDSLSQFRLYGQGTGYSLGLQRSYLQRLAAAIAPRGGAGVVACDYSERRLHEFCDAWAKQFFATARDLDRDGLDPGDLWRAISSKTDLFGQRLLAQVKFKSSQFEVEQEVRFYKLGFAGKRCWRISRGGNNVIPYLEVELPNDSCRAIITPGPNTEGFLANQSASQLIQAADEHGTAWEIALAGMAASNFRYAL